jgi:hypothetical protein
MQDICKELSGWKGLEDGKVFDHLDGLEDMIDTHQDNAKNLCRVGGYIYLVDMIMNHPNSKVRKQACTILTLGT